MTDQDSYKPIRPGKCRSLGIRQVRYNVTEWGDPDAPTFVYLHGWADAGTTFQFVVDALQDDWHVVAPDWRGFGRSTIDCTSYWFPDYVADLHELLDLYSPGEPARIVGHSMGANVGGLYAGTIPERVSAFVNVEGFGLKDSDPRDAPRRYRQWLEQSQSQSVFMTYRDIGSLAARIANRNPLLNAAQAEYVARAWARVREDGEVELRADPRHKLPNPILYRRAEAEACWDAITAPVLLVTGSASDFPPGEVKNEIVEIEGAGHMLHFDAPAELAAAIESFLSKYL